jgi:hypothetical protein
MSLTRFINPPPVAERSGWRYTGTLKDQAGIVVPGSALTTLTIRIYVVNTALTDIVTPPVSILNTGRGTITEQGLLTIDFTPADSAITETAELRENHRALVEAVWSSGTKEFAHEIEWTINNMSKRT